MGDAHSRRMGPDYVHFDGDECVPAQSEWLDVERWTWAEHLVTVHGARRQHGEPCYHRRGDVGDLQRTKDIADEYERLGSSQPHRSHAIP